MAKPVVVKFLGDSKSFDNVTAGVNKRLGDFASTAEREGRRAGDGFDRAAEGADNAENKAQGFASTLEGTKDSMEGVANIAKGNLFEGFVQLGGGLADLAEGFNYTVIPAAKAAANAFRQSTLATIRERQAKIASAIASKAATAATIAQTVATRALNLAMRMNPIGLVITAIVLLGTVIVVAYKRSETFRNIVQSVWKGVRGSVLTAVDFIVKALRGWLNVSFTVVEGILKVFGRLPGPMGEPFRKAEGAVKKAKETINRQMDGIQGRINRLRGKDVPVTATAKITLFEKTRRALVAMGIKGYGTKFLSKGGRLFGYGGGDRNPAMLEDGEAVVPKHLVREPGFMAWAKARGIPGFQSGGLVNLGGRAVGKLGGLAANKLADVVGDTLGGIIGRTGGGNWGSGSWKRAISELIADGVAYSIVSTFRQGARTAASGSVSFHALNRAVDLVGPNMMRIFNSLRDTNPTELIYSPASMYKSRRGWNPIGQLDPITRGNHWDHVHAAYRDGTGHVPRDGVYRLHKGEGVMTSRENRQRGMTVVVNAKTNANPWDIAQEVGWVARTAGY